jgi:hypothetical protein
VTLALLLTACSTGGTLAVDDDARVDFEGTVFDPLADDAPVAEAWIIVDTGDELISIRSGADGGFLIPDLPANTPITATVAAQDRQARTNADLVLADQELPMEVGLSYRDMADYPVQVHTVSGRAIDAPPGSWMLISGAGMEEYTYVQAEQGPTPFEFEFERLASADSEEPYVFSALSFVNETGELLGAAVAEVEWGDDMEVDLVFGGEQPIDLDVHSPAPLLDGELVEELDSEYMTSLCLTYLNESWGSFLGWNLGWDHEGDGFVFHASYVPVAGYPARVAAYLVEDLTDSEAMSYIAVPLEEGQSEVTVEPLDAPELDTHADFAPGMTVGWTPIEDVTRKVLFVRDDEGANAWWIGTDSDEISFPRLPDEFDPSLLLEGEGTWHVRVSRFDEVDGEFDSEGPYAVGETLGGEIEID